MAMLKGRFHKKIYSNWNDQYHVFAFESEDGKMTTVIYRGAYPPAITGKKFVISGYWKRSVTYGLQFVVKRQVDENEFNRKRKNSMDNIYQMLA